MIRSKMGQSNSKRKKILVLVGGGVKHIQPFIDAATELDVELDCVSFAKISYEAGNGEVKVFADGKDIADYSVIYLRVVGRRFEDAALVVYYAKTKGVKIVDRVYEKDGIIRIPLPKSIESKLLADAGLPMPKTYFGRTKMMKTKAVELFGFPFVIKSTTGKQGHGVWSPRNHNELDELIEKFTEGERKDGKRYLAQEFIHASQRNRILVIGGKAIAGITRPTRWRKRWQKKVNGHYPEGVNKTLLPVPKEDAEIALKACRVLGIDVGGADIITDEFTGKKYILEVNAAPRWHAVKKDTGINVEKEIIKYLLSL